MCRQFHAYFHGRENPRRITSFARAFYGILALDIWVLMLSHGARYGVDGFNVPHFSWLSALPWPVTPTLYVGVMCLAGWLALFCTLLPHRTGVRVGVCLLYSYGWAMSMLDSYQHHYLLSLILVCLCFVPRDAFVRMPAAATMPVWSFRLMTATVALAYLFAALSKLELGWYDGRVLAHVMRPYNFLGFDWLKSQLGSQFWPVMAHSVIVIECLIGLAYLALPWLSLSWRLIAFALCAMLHLSIDAIGLHIGWFSYYMLLIAACSFAPSGCFNFRSFRLAWTFFADWRVVVSLGVACVLAIWVVAAAAQLPGVSAASACYAAWLSIVAVFDLGRGKPDEAGSVTIAGLIGTLLVWLVLNVSDVRFDYYRYAGRDAERQARFQMALTLYQKAEAFAPQGKSRADKIRTLQQRIAIDKLR